MTYREFWVLYNQNPLFWSAQTTEKDEPDHITAWEWLCCPDTVELYGYHVQVRHPVFTRGEWVAINFI